MCGPTQPTRPHAIIVLGGGPRYSSRAPIEQPALVADVPECPCFHINRVLRASLLECVGDFSTYLLTFLQVFSGGRLENAARILHFSISPFLHCSILPFPDRCPDYYFVINRWVKEDRCVDLRCLPRVLRRTVGQPQPCYRPNNKFNSGRLLQFFVGNVPWRPDLIGSCI